MTRSNIVIKKKHNTRSKIIEMKKNSKLILKFTIKPKVTIDSSFIDDSIESLLLTSEDMFFNHLDAEICFSI